MPPLGSAPSGRTSKRQDIRAHAIRVLGTPKEAECWLNRPAIGLNGRRPIDLLSDPVGVETVETFLSRIEHGVYT